MCYDSKEALPKTPNGKLTAVNETRVQYTLSVFIEIKDFDAGDKKKKVDAHSFIEYITGKDLSGYMSSLKPKPTKKKPLSFERLSMIIIPIFKYFEDEKVFKSDNARINKTLDLWLTFVKSQKEQSVNTLFET